MYPRCPGRSCAAVWTKRCGTSGVRRDREPRWPFLAKHPPLLILAISTLRNRSKAIVSPRHHLSLLSFPSLCEGNEMVRMDLYPMCRWRAVDSILWFDAVVALCMNGFCKINRSRASSHHRCLDRLRRSQTSSTFNQSVSESLGYWRPVVGDVLRKFWTGS